jgi:hypothetical protein
MSASADIVHRQRNHVVARTDILARRNHVAACEFGSSRSAKPMLRSVLAELFPNWLRREVIHEQKTSRSGSLSALESLQKRIRMADKAKGAKPQVRKPAAPERSTKADPDRKNPAEDAPGTPGPGTSGPPVRDVRDSPAPNPDGDPRGKVAPRPEEKPSGT